MLRPALVPLALLALLVAAPAATATEPLLPPLLASALEDEGEEEEYGGVGLGTFERRLGRSGVLRFSRPTKQEGKRLVVRIDGGAGCPSRRLALRG